MREGLFGRIAGALAAATALTACQGSMSQCEPITPASIAHNRTPHTTEECRSSLYRREKTVRILLGGLTYM